MRRHVEAWMVLAAVSAVICAMGFRAGMLAERNRWKPMTVVNFPLALDVPPPFASVDVNFKTGYATLLCGRWGQYRTPCPWETK